MNEEIRIPEEPADFVPEYDLDGCIIIRGDNGEPVNPISAATFQPITLTCIPSDAIIVETTSLEPVGDVFLEGAENVLGNGFPVSVRLFGDES